jgi:hypothetical protein
MRGCRSHHQVHQGLLHLARPQDVRVRLEQILRHVRLTLLVRGPERLPDRPRCDRCS